MKNKLVRESIDLLKDLISISSFSGQEADTANLIQKSFEDNEIPFKRKHHNLYALSSGFDLAKPTLLLNSHHDTVRPTGGWASDPFKPLIMDDKIIGLGSNDAGASLVSLMAVFQIFFKRNDLSHNLILALTAEEENSGENGIRSLLSDLGSIDLAIIGEPTGMQMAIAEKGLMVLRCKATGRSGHAARNNGENAIYKALDDIEWIKNYKFIEDSRLLGPAKMTVTMVNAGTQHNVIPDLCEFTVDIRTTETCDNEMILDLFRKNVKADFNQPTLNLRPSSIPVDHKLVTIAKSLGIKTFGSPTLSDQTYISGPSVKMGPGLSERSHTPNEFVYLSEIEEGIEIYIKLLDKFLRNNNLLGRDQVTTQERRNQG
jgi:acetylornithine deacetylase